MRRTAAARTPRLAVDELRWILDRLPTGVVVIEPDLTVCFRNLAAQRLAHPIRLRVGSPLPDLDSDPPLRQVAFRLFDQGVLGEQELRTPSGKTFLVDGVVHARTHVAVLHIDDDTIRARQSRAEHDFAVNVAHEFLSPLTAIAGAAHVLEANRDEAPEVRERFLRHIVTGTVRLIAISRALLMLARIEAGVEPPRLELVRLRPVLVEVLETVARSAQTDLQCPATLSVIADVDLLRQALLTLVENACRHARGSAIQMVVDEVGDDRVGIEIVDAGRGIEPEALANVTDRFVVGAGGRDGGYGVGLSIAKRAIEAVGGTLGLESSPAGTRARLELRAARIVPR